MPGSRNVFHRLVPETVPHPSPFSPSGTSRAPIGVRDWRLSGGTRHLTHLISTNARDGPECTAETFPAFQQEYHRRTGCYFRYDSFISARAPNVGSAAIQIKLSDHGNLAVKQFRRTLGFIPHRQIFSIVLLVRELQLYNCIHLLYHATFHPPPLRPQVLRCCRCASGKNRNGRPYWSRTPIVTPYQVHCVWCRSDVNLDRQRQTTYKTRAWETYRNSDIHTDEGCIGSSYVTCSRGAWEVLRHHVKRAGVNPSAQLRLTAWRAGAVEIQRTKSRAKQARRNATAWMQQQ
ncbi:hypothetical protein B0H14DRAFT_3125883 [Mycena olivaceomarginata]|nr:hypothetical protein B0H14DRAFT_3125883 [Mycena olivaceomarginata]